jgi:pSer/pThr/pTyr-binding forkhead associated (FHA) protein
MTAVALPRTGFKFVMTVRDGPDVGATFQLLPPRVTIGRGGENHIALNDPRVSRQAAIIEFSIERITITDISGRESMMVNGYTIQESAIKDGDLIHIGETELKFVVEALPLGPAIHPATFDSATSPALRPQAVPNLNFETPSFGLPPSNTTTNLGGGGSRSTRRTANDEGAKKIRFYIIVAAAAGFFFYFMNQEPGTKAGAKGIPTVEQIESGIKDSVNRKEAIEKRRFKTEEERTRANESQRHFMEGFRDYQKSQWSRAIRSFETAQAIDPKNEIAGRYRRLAEKQRDEMVNILTIEGRRYREKSMYTRCSAAFEKVLIEIPNKQDLKYKAAEALKNECDAASDERYR